MINQSIPSQLFYGAYQGDPRTCGARGHIFLEDNQSIIFKVGVGECSNNLVELMALFWSILLALEKGVNSIYIYGDYILVFKWKEGIHDE